MVKAVTAPSPRPYPAQVARLAAVEQPEDVDDPAAGETGEDPPFRQVPALASLGDRARADAALGERRDAPVDGLGPRRVEVTAEDSRTVAGPGERLVERLEGLDLDPAVRRLRNIGAVELDRGDRRLDEHG